jgi:hypothetical protein
MRGNQHSFGGIDVSSAAGIWPASSLYINFTPCAT